MPSVTGKHLFFTQDSPTTLSALLGNVDCGTFQPHFAVRRGQTFILDVLVPMESNLTSFISRHATFQSCYDQDGCRTLLTRHEKRNVADELLTLLKSAI